MHSCQTFTLNFQMTVLKSTKCLFLSISYCYLFIFTVFNQEPSQAYKHRLQIGCLIFNVLLIFILLYFLLYHITILLKKESCCQVCIYNCQTNHVQFSCDVFFILTVQYNILCSIHKEATFMDQL